MTPYSRLMLAMMNGGKLEESLLKVQKRVVELFPAKNGQFS